MPSKSIFRQPGARHFQLVHRSQRDPLINDSEAGTHVLKPIKREKSNKEKSRADLESILTLDDTSEHGNIGEASLYGIYFDDTEYDYMQHLRAFGTQDVGSILIEGPVESKRGAKPTSGNFLNALELPDGVLASASELPRNFEMQQAIPDTIAGFQPDMNPHLRQVLEALDDDAFVDENLDDNFFSNLVADGERGSNENFDFEVTADGISENEDDIDAVEEGSWEKRFSDFKMRHKESLGSDNEVCDSVCELPTISVIGRRKRRRKGSSEASGFSMSSSSMYRSEALQTLDDRFDQIMLKEYYDTSDDEDDMSKNEEQSNEAPELITSRNDFDSMVNDFLNNYEFLGRKMRLKLEGESGPEKLNFLRRSLGADSHVRIGNVESEEDREDLFLSEQEDEKAKWDCETILSTHTNLGNHPRLIRARDSKPVPKFQLDHKTGLPSVLAVAGPKEISDQGKFVYTSEESDDGAKTVPSKTTTRPRNESKQDKKLRKAAVKQEKQARRTERKIIKQQFGVELQEQRKRLDRQQNMKKL